jgi:hypothetical protein
VAVPGSLVAARDSGAVSGAVLELASAAPVGAGSVPKRQAARSQPSTLRAQDDTVLFGYWPAGGPDPWRDTADFLPALFGYTELYEVSTGRMSHPPRRADEQQAP